MRAQMMVVFCLLVGSTGVLASPTRPDGYEASVAARETKFLNEVVKSNGPVPDQLDWRQVPDRVSEVSDQGGRCNSGYAFATVGLLEGQLVAQNVTNHLVKLSAQQLVDCSKIGGCEIDSVDSSLEVVRELGGLQAEATYKYKGKVGRCLSEVDYKIVPKDYKFIPKWHEELMMKVVANYGPIVTAIRSSLPSFKNYTGGVYADPACNIPPVGIDHNVLVVGYGTDPYEGHYWLMKNSWGTKWGEQGYFRIKRGVNMCGLAHFPLIALF